MSAVERLEPGRDGLAPQPEEPKALDIDAKASPARRSKLRPLLALSPYVARYRGRAILALIALTVAAVTTLVVQT